MTNYNPTNLQCAVGVVLAFTEASIKYIPEGSKLKDAPLWWHLKGLSYTRSGYGNKIPTSRMVQFPGEKIWRRVYCVIWSNSGSYYVLSKGQRLYL